MFEISFEQFKKSRVRNGLLLNRSDRTTHTLFTRCLIWIATPRILHQHSGRRSRTGPLTNLYTRESRFGSGWLTLRTSQRVQEVPKLISISNYWCLHLFSSSTKIVLITNKTPKRIPITKVWRGILTHLVPSSSTYLYMVRSPVYRIGQGWYKQTKYIFRCLIHSEINLLQKCRICFQTLSDKSLKFVESCT